MANFTIGSQPFCMVQLKSKPLEEIFILKVANLRSWQPLFIFQCHRNMFFFNKKR
jgi:hypothetical protein